MDKQPKKIARPRSIFADFLIATTATVVGGIITLKILEAANDQRKTQDMLVE